MTLFYDRLVQCFCGGGREHIWNPAGTSQRFMPCPLAGPILKPVPKTAAAGWSRRP